MRRAFAIVLLLGCAALSVPAAGCGGGKDPATPDAATEPDAYLPPDVDLVFPPLRNRVSLPDDELALAALKVLGANVPGASTTSCNECHALTRQQLRNWRALTDTARATCLADTDLSTQAEARTVLDCLRAMPGVPTSDFLARKLGIYSAASHLAWFDVATRYAYGPASGQMVATELLVAAGMPRSGGIAVPLKQPEFDLIAEWFERGLPRLEGTLPVDPAPTTCTPSVSSEVGTHVAAMQTQGWRALNASNMMAMYGCGTATEPLECLQSVPLAKDQPYGTTWDIAGRGQLRVLADVTYRSSFWTRSSPDGRFIGHGVQTVSGSYVIDLQRGGALIPINVSYDPNWFPDNSGFIFQGGPQGRNTCGQSVLTANPTQVTMLEPQCTSLNTIGLYQHVGAVNGGDHFAIDSRFVSDDGGHGATLRDPYANFGATASMGFIPLVYDGTKFTSKAQVTVSAPYEGDSVLSPSARMVVSRVAGTDDKQLGFVLRKVNATPQGATYDIETPEVARYCFSGGKPGFSYDERYIVYHHYLSATDADAIELGFANATDPGFAPYRTQGAANVYLLDLTTGKTLRITNMKPGQYALFPHFRSDGWIYAVVRDGAANHEYMVASDAALLAEP